MIAIRQKIHEAFRVPDSRLFLWLNDFLAVVTLVSVAALILETVDGLAAYRPFFETVEYTAVLLFTLEYVGRMISRESPFAYAFSFFGVVDLLSVAPTYLALGNFTFLKSARVLRILKFLRMIRLAKLARTTPRRHRDLEEHSYLYKINVFIYFFALLSAVIIFGTLLFIFEGGQYQASNIPLGMIWAAKVIMGGVAQVLPQTIFGEIVIVFARFTGLVLFGLLIHIVGVTVTRFLFGSPSLGSSVSAFKGKQVT